MKTMNKETLEEAAYRLYPIVLEDDEWDKNKQYRDEWIEGAKWQQEQFKNESTANYIDRHIVEALVETAKQERMYSEEEVKELLTKYLHYLTIDSDIDADTWFEQNKKK